MKLIRLTDSVLACFLKIVLHRALALVAKNICPRNSQTKIIIIYCIKLSQYVCFYCAFCSKNIYIILHKWFMFFKYVSKKSSKCYNIIIQTICSKAYWNICIGKRLCSVHKVQILQNNYQIISYGILNWLHCTTLTLPI